MKPSDLTSLTRCCFCGNETASPGLWCLHRRFVVTATFKDFKTAIEWVSFFPTHTHTLAKAEGKWLLPPQTSKPAVSWGTSNAGEAIKRQKNFFCKVMIYLIEKWNLTQQTLFPPPFQGGSTRHSRNCCQVGSLLRAGRPRLRSTTSFAFLFLQPASSSYCVSCFIF